jgi:hypothetical protein
VVPLVVEAAAFADPGPEQPRGGDARTKQHQHLLAAAARLRLVGHGQLHEVAVLCRPGRSYPSYARL